MLTGGPWDHPARQQTLRGAIAWSDDLLSAAERGLFYRLAVFHGGFTADAAAAVGADASVVAALLESLADQSLIQRIRRGGRGRALYAAGNAPRVRPGTSDRQRGVRYIPGATRRLFPGTGRARRPGTGAGRPGALAGAARSGAGQFPRRLAYLLARGDHERAARLGGALGRFWYLRATFAEGRRWLHAALAEPSALPPAVLATALHWAGVLAWSQGDHDEARALLGASLAQRRALDEPSGIAAVLTSLGAVALTEGDYGEAGALFTESLGLSRAADDRPGVALALANLGLIRLDAGRYDEAAALLQESLGLRRTLGDRQSIAQCLNNLGIVRRCQGAYGAARALHAESLALFQELGDRWSQALVLANLGVVRLEEGAGAEAARLLGESLRLFQEQGVKAGIASCLDGLAWVAAHAARSSGRPGWAARPRRCARRSMCHGRPPTKPRTAAI